MPPEVHFNCANKSQRVLVRRFLVISFSACLYLSGRTTAHVHPDLVQVPFCHFETRFNQKSLSSPRRLGETKISVGRVSGFAAKERRCSLGRAINLDAAKRDTAHRDANESEIFAAERPRWPRKLGRAIHLVKKGTTMRVTWRSGMLLRCERCYVAGRAVHRSRSAEPKGEAARQRAKRERRRGLRGMYRGPIGHTRCVDRTG